MQGDEMVVSKKVESWLDRDFYARLDRCRRFLFVHGMVTEHEANLIHRRIKKLIEREAKRSRHPDKEREDE